MPPKRMKAPIRKRSRPKLLKRCGVCKKAIRRDQLFTLDCKHHFHKECLDDLHNQMNLSRCPVCSKKISQRKKNLLERCTICQFPLESNTIRLKCGHRYHKDCLAQYYSHSNQPIRCPQCQTYVNSNIARIFKRFPKYYEKYIRRAKNKGKRANDTFSTNVQNIKSNYEEELSNRKKRATNFVKFYAVQGQSSNRYIKTFVNLLSNQLYDRVVPRKNSTKIVKNLINASENSLPNELDNLFRFDTYDEDYHYNLLADRDCKKGSRSIGPFNLLKTSRGRQLTYPVRRWLYERFKYPVRHKEFENLRMVNIRNQLL